MSDNLKSVLEESSISQVVITVIIMVGAIVVQVVQGTIPDWMQFVVATLVGFYFGAKSTSLTNKVADVIKKVSDTAASTAPVSSTVTSTVTTVVDPASKKVGAKKAIVDAKQIDKVDLPAQVIGNDGAVATINPVENP